MLSVGRGEYGEKRPGFAFERRGKEEDMEEMEEGEARCSMAAADDGFIDPDVDFSYIDEKIQNVLGQFQKDFEGGVFAENLGAMYGGYGSFLPTHQRSPRIRPQTTTPPSASSYNVSRSQCRKLAEDDHLNPSVDTVISASKNRGNFTTEPPENSGRMDMCTNMLNAKDSNLHHNSVNKQANGGGQKTLKVRIKVSGNNVLDGKDAAAIYSGLGLDSSPFSSSDESSDCNKGLSPVLRDSPHESPSTILQMMTCFPVEVEHLLSPLPDRLLHLEEEKGSWYLKTFQAGILCKDTQDNHAFLDDQTSPRGDVNGHLEKKASSVGRGRIFTNGNNSNLKDPKRTILKQAMNTDAGRDLVSDALSIPVLSSYSKGVDVKAEAGQGFVSDALSSEFKVGLKGTERKMENQLTGESAKLTSRMPAISRDSDKVSSRDIISSVESAKKNKFNFTGSSEKGMAAHLGNEKKHMKVKLCAKIGSSENALEERKTSGPKIVPCHFQGEGSDEHEKNYHGARGKRNHSVGSTENINQKTIRKATPHEHVGEEMLQRKSMPSEVRRKSLGSQVNDLPSAEFSKENPKLYLSTSSNEKIFQTRGDHSQTKSKGLKSLRGSNESLGREFSKEVPGKPKVEEVDNGTSLPDTHSKYRLKDAKLGNKNPKERPSAKSEALIKEPVLTPSTSIPASDVVAAPNDPVPLDNWIECVRCKIWRLLPYGINPRDLPEEWTCKMQTWLRGMNRCGLSEKETEKAVYALCQVRIPEKGSNLNGHYDVTASSFATAHHLDQNPEPSMPRNGEKKSGLKDTPTVHERSTPTEFSDPVKKNQQVSIKSRRLHDAKDVIRELDTFSGAGFEQMSKSADSITQTLKVKGKDESFRHSSEGVKHSKTRIKRQVVEDGCRISKKMKTQDSSHSDKDWHSDHDTVVKAVSNKGNICSTNGQYFQKYKNSSYSNDSTSKDYKLTVDKKLKPQVSVNSDGDLKHQFALDIERSVKPDCAVKKQRVKGWEETQATQEFLDRSQHHGGLNIIDEFSECDPRKENNDIILKFEGKESSSSKGSDIAVKKARTTRFRLAGSKTQAADGIHECRDIAERDHHVVQHQVNMPSQQALGSNDYLKKDISNRRLSRTANSSSSKVSGSRKNKANFQGARGSPVESVSSSPLRILNIEKNAARKNSVVKDDARQKTCLDGDVDSAREQSKIRKKKALDQASYLESHKAGDSGVQDSFCYEDDVSNHLSSRKAKGKVRLKLSGSTQYNLTHDLQETELVGGSANIYDQQKVNNQNKLFEPPGEGPVHDQDVVNNQQNTNRCIQQTAGKSSLCVTGGYKSSETGFGKVKLKYPNSLSGQEEFHPAMDGSSASKFGTKLNSHCYPTYEEYTRERNYIFREENEKDNSGSKVTTLGRSAKCLSTGDTQFPSRTPKQRKILSSRSGLSDAIHVKSNPEKNLQQATSHNDGKSSAEHVLHRVNQSEVASGDLKQESLLPSRDKQEVHSQDPNTLHAPQRKRRSEVLFLDSTNGATPNVVEQNKNIDNHTVLVGRHNSLRHPSPDGFDAQRPIKESNQSTAEVSLKEASDLKHNARCLKDKGLEYESAGLYFQAALKLLHVASLWEPTDGDLIKCMEATQSLSLYVETAKLCELCASAFERYKQLAAAALAYKCMEVARFKVACLKHPIASKDQQELQAALQMVIPGESPLSSVSDVDNLINLGKQEMSTSTKGVSSPQTAGNFVISDRLRPTYTRWLDYIFETTCPFEASKKACNAFAAAIAGLEKENNIMSSVKQVLDINFSNIEELLRLVRLSMKSINC